AERGAAIAARRAYSFQYRLLLPDVQERVVIESGEPISDDGYAGTLMDVTDKVRTERNLAEAQRIAGLGIWSVDANGEIRWSEQMYQLIGAAPRAEPPSVAFWAAHIHAEDRERVLAAYAEG